MERRDNLKSPHLEDHLEYTANREGTTRNLKMPAWFKSGVKEAVTGKGT